MTLIVALKTRDGVVVAADSQATIGTQVATRQGGVQKLFCLGESIVWGSAGAVGLTQRAAEALEKLGNDKKRCEGPLASLRPEIKRTIGKVLKEGNESFVPSGHQTHWQGNAFLFAGHTGGLPWILEIGPTGADQDHDPHSAIGSGDVFAYFAQASMQHLPLKTATDQTGRMIVYRTIATACRVSAFGISEPIQMWSATAKGCHELEQAELDAVRDSVTVWHELEADLRPQLVGTNTPESHSQDFSRTT